MFLLLLVRVLGPLPSLLWLRLLPMERGVRIRSDGAPAALGGLGVRMRAGAEAGIEAGTDDAAAAAADAAAAEVAASLASRVARVVRRDSNVSASEKIESAIPLRRWLSFTTRCAVSATPRAG